MSTAVKEEKVNIFNLQEITEKLHGVGYLAQRPELLALKWLLGEDNIHSGTKSLLVEGLPGVGKTFLSQSFASAFNFDYKYYLCHSWSDDQELLKGVDVAEAVAGNADKVSLPGILSIASKASQKGKIVVCLDEIDKTEDRTQNLLLDWLQTGRAQWTPGKHIQGNAQNLIVFITSNATKPISSALLRRLRRLRMSSLSEDIQVKLISDFTKYKEEHVKAIIQTAHKIAELDKREVSLQELANMTKEVIENTECVHDTNEIISSWVLRSDREMEKAEPLSQKLYEETIEKARK